MYTKRNQLILINAIKQVHVFTPASRALTDKVTNYSQIGKGRLSMFFNVQNSTNAHVTITQKSSLIIIFQR